MTIPQFPNRATDDERRTWVIGGALLLATVVIGVAVQPVASLIGGDFIRTAAFSAALLVFAFGIRGAGSVTARRPLGTAALIVLATWVLLVSALTTVISSSDFPLTPLAFSYIDSFVKFAAALVAVVQISRASVVPHPWNWAPAWALAAVVVPWVLEQIAVVGAPRNVPPLAFFIIALDGVVHIGGPLFLGVLAIVLANRTRRPQTVPVYPSSD